MSLVKLAGTVQARKSSKKPAAKKSAVKRTTKAAHVPKRKPGTVPKNVKEVFETVHEKNKKLLEWHVFSDGTIAIMYERWYNELRLTNTNRTGRKLHEMRLLTRPVKSGYSSTDYTVDNWWTDKKGNREDT